MPLDHCKLVLERRAIRWGRNFAGKAPIYLDGVRGAETPLFREVNVLGIYSAAYGGSVLPTYVT